MHLSGSKEFPTSPLETFGLLTNPDVIVRAMPGLKSLQPESEHVYKAELEVGVAGIKGSYAGQLEMRDIIPGSSYRLLVNGEGTMGFLESDVQVTLQADEAGTTTVSYEGEAKVGGTVAGVGQRMLSGVAKLLINQFFNGVLKAAKTSS